jgi:uncharacterized membrane protein YfcA
MGRVSWYFVSTFNALTAAAAFGSAFAAGAINSVAGGGTLISFPTLVWLGLDPIAANATSTVAIWPGTVGSLWGYRRELENAERRYRILIVPSLAGGLLGALLLRWTPSKLFGDMVPFLILFATVLLSAQDVVQRMLKTAHTEGHRSGRWLAGAIAFQFLVGVYGGFFGAGIGILMLAALGILGLKDIHEMNSLKVVFGGTINGIAAAYFVVAGMVHWPHVLAMAAGAIAGGYGGAGVARRMGQRTVRGIVIAVGFAMAISLFIKN